MYAVFKTGGKQYRASKGDVITVEKLEAEKGATVEIDQVLMVGEGDDVKVGTPFLDGGKVSATVVDHGRHDKIKVLKFKRRKNYKRQMGHRQYFTQLEITGIEA
ncbi:MAG: 50S ribosomal protein L21 [Xanthomonadales bacterium]|nr:50S ribosomal protein L21 [Xanthomonadales bacterium]